MNTKDFLIELGTEELPPKLLPRLSSALKQHLLAELESKNLSFTDAKAFATPRRLAVLVSDLQLKQDDQEVQRKGPKVGAPDQALEGFARSCGVDKDKLEIKTLGNSEYYFFSSEEKGKLTSDLLESVVDQAIKNIPIAKPMRWGDLDFNFVRPLHWFVMLLGSDVVDATVMGLKAGNITRGLRFSGEKNFTIDSAKNYRETMFKKAQIEVDFDQRKQMIREQIMQVAKDNKSTAVIDEALLDEVTALVEYPRAFAGNFDKRFLSVPQEALISAMKSHQKYFHMVDNKAQLLPIFISVANIESSDMSVVINGNERVIRPRLTDSEFFWQQDKSTSLESRLEKLDRVLFMKSLGSVGDKSKRIAKLAEHIAGLIGANTQQSQRAGALCKADLVSDMVGEFADLQGVMGGYYALNDGEDDAVATAIREHYNPKFSGDTLPSTLEGLSVAIADKIDTITGIYGIGQGPTGSKDPYALRRMALGLLRMIIESKLKINLKDLIDKSLGLHVSTVNRDAQNDIYNFMMDRLRAYYKDRDVNLKAFDAVLAVSPDSPYDFELRLEAVNEFMRDDASESLIEANKRIANILKEHNDLSIQVNQDILQDEAEKQLFRATNKVAQGFEKAQTDYPQTMQLLLQLKDTIDVFFEQVMVNTKDESLKRERLNLLFWIRSLFLSVADVSHLT